MLIKFLIGTVVILVFYALSSWGVITFLGKESVIKDSLFYSGVLATAFVLITFFTTVFISAKVKVNFNKVFLITLGIRFFVMLGLIIVFLTKVVLDQFTFIVSLFILYFLFQIWEVYIIHTQLTQE